MVKVPASLVSHPLQSHDSPGVYKHLSIYTPFKHVPAWAVVSACWRMLERCVCALTMYTCQAHALAQESQAVCVTPPAFRQGPCPARKHRLTTIAQWAFAGALISPAQAHTNMSAAFTPRISIQPFATPGQKSFVGSYGSVPTSWGGRSSR